MIPLEILNIIMTYMSSPTARLIKDFKAQVQQRWEDDTGLDYDNDEDFRYAVWSNEENDMKHRFCIQDIGIFREGIEYDAPNY
jgi:hypothetical protein